MKIYANKTNINASYSNPVKTNLADFGIRELIELRDILNAWIDGSGLPWDFDSDGVIPAFNENSGSVFLTNAEYQVAVLDDGILKSWYTTSYDGHEGTFEDLMHEAESSDWEQEDLEDLLNIAEIRDESDDTLERIRELISIAEGTE